jgi:hypothetical protein
MIRELGRETGKGTIIHLILILVEVVGVVDVQTSYKTVVVEILISHTTHKILEVVEVITSHKETRVEIRISLKTHRIMEVVEIPISHSSEVDRNLLPCKISQEKRTKISLGRISQTFEEIFREPRRMKAALVLIPLVMIVITIEVVNNLEALILPSTMTTNAVEIMIMIVFGIVTMVVAVNVTALVAEKRKERKEDPTRDRDQKKGKTNIATRRLKKSSQD